VATRTAPTAEASSETIVREQRPVPAGKRLGRRTVISIGLIILCLGGGAMLTMLVASLKEPPKRATPAERVHAVQVFETEQVTLQELVMGFGTARAMREVVVSAQVAGEIVETMKPLKVGKQVQAAKSVTNADGTSSRTGGDLVVRIDPQTYQERVEQAEDALNEDEAELNRLKQEQKNLKRRLQIAHKNFAAYQKEYDRVAELVEKDVASTSDLTTAQLELTRYEDAIVQIETELALIPQKIEQVQARQRTRLNELELSKLDLNRSAVRAPMTGRLSEVHVEQGQYVKVGEPLVTITSTDRVEIPVGIPIEDYLKLVPQIESGDFPDVAVSTRATRRGTWSGQVTRAAPVADPQTRTVDLFVVVDNQKSQTKLLPGTFVTVLIDGPVFEDVIPIPRDAVIDDFVYLAREDRALQVDLPPGDNLQSMRLVKEELQPGDRIIMTNLDIISDGDKIRLTGEDDYSLDAELERMLMPTLRILSDPDSFAE